MKSPERGEVWIVDLGMAAKVRPALVVSVAVLDDDRAIITIVPHTTSIRSTRFEVALPVHFLKDGAFDCQNLITISRAKFQKRLGSLKTDEMANIDAGIRRWLGLGP